MPNEVVRSEIRKQTMTVSEAANALGVGRSAAYEAARTGEIPTIRIGRRVLVPVAALEALLHGQTVATQSRNKDRGAGKDVEPVGPKRFPLGGGEDG